MHWPPHYISLADPDLRQISTHLHLHRLFKPSYYLPLPQISVRSSRSNVCPCPALPCTAQSIIFISPGGAQICLRSSLAWVRFASGSGRTSVCFLPEYELHKTAFTRVKSRFALVYLVLRLVVHLHAKIALYTRKWLLTAI